MYSIKRSDLPPPLEIEICLYLMFGDQYLTGKFVDWKTPGTAGCAAKLGCCGAGANLWGSPLGCVGRP